MNENGLTHREPSPTIIAQDVSGIQYTIRHELSFLLNEKALFDIEIDSPYLFKLITNVMDRENLALSYYYCDILFQDILTYYIVKKVFKKHSSYKFSNPDRTLFIAYNIEQIEYLIHILKLETNAGFLFYMNHLIKVIDNFVIRVIDDIKVESYFFKPSLNGSMYFMSFYISPTSLR